MLPNMFNVKINAKILNINGRYFSPLPIVLMLTVSRMKLYKISATAWHRPGTNFELLKVRIKNEDVSSNASTINKEEFVKLKLYPAT